MTAGSGHGPSLLFACETVLVVEDEPELRALVAQYLKDIGLTVLEAADGRTAIEQLSSGKTIELLFADIRLTGNVTGRELAEEARRLVPSIKVLLTTGNPGGMETADQLQASAAGATAFTEILAKPYHLDNLARALRRCLDGDT